MDGRSIGVSSMNYIKVKVRVNPGSKEPISLISWLSPGVAYPIIDVYKYLERNKDTGVSTFRTWLLVGNPKTGVFGWAESHKVDFAGWDGMELDLKPNISTINPEEFEKTTSKAEEKPKEPPKPADISFAF
jgi:hypothetical protein